MWGSSVCYSVFCLCLTVHTCAFEDSYHDLSCQGRLTLCVSIHRIFCLFTSSSTCMSTWSSVIMSSNGYLMFPVVRVLWWYYVVVAESSWVVCCHHGTSWEDWVVIADFTGSHSAENCFVFEMLVIFWFMHFIFLTCFCFISFASYLAFIK